MTRKIIGPIGTNSTTEHPYPLEAYYEVITGVGNSALRDFTSYFFSHKKDALAHAAKERKNPKAQYVAIVPKGMVLLEAIQWERQPLRPWVKTVIIEGW